VRVRAGSWLGVHGSKQTRRCDPKRTAARQPHFHPRAGANDEHLVPGTRGRADWRDRAGVFIDRGELPIVAGSVHYHHRAAWGAGRNLLDAVVYAYDAERAVVD